MQPIRKTLLGLGAAALCTLPVWLPTAAFAHPNSNEHAVENRGQERSAHARGHGKAGDHGRSCKAREVAYVASGTLVSETLTANADGTYSGELTVEVKRTNHPGRADAGKTVTYKLTDGRVTLGPKAEAGKPVSIEAVKAGDRTRVLGRITFLPRRCSQEGFTPTVTVKHVIFHSAA